MLLQFVSQNNLMVYSSSREWKRMRFESLAPKQIDIGDVRELKISLHKAEMKDCVEIHEMQLTSFQPLLEKYKDYATSPGAESLEIIKQKMAYAFTDYYFISLGNVHIGVIRVVRLEDNVCRISPMFIRPEYQGIGPSIKAKDMRSK